ncbi:MAG: phage tail protein [Pseudomonadota bacterium]
MAIATYPEIVYDADHEYGGDLSLSATGDLQLVSQSERSNQRVLRRLLTNPVDYIWHPEYGAGIKEFVGAPLTDTLYAQSNARIIANNFLEASVSQNPPPVISMQTIQGGIYAGINYVMAATLLPTVLNFKVE